MKSIINPGNGILFPKKGEYVKLKMRVLDNNNNVLFDSQNCNAFYFRFKMSNHQFKER